MAETDALREVPRKNNRANADASHLHSEVDNHRRAGGANSSDDSTNAARTGLTFNRDANVAELDFRSLVRVASAGDITSLSFDGSLVHPQSKQAKPGARNFGLNEVQGTADPHLPILQLTDITAPGLRLNGRPLVLDFNPAGGNDLLSGLQAAKESREAAEAAARPTIVRDAAGKLSFVKQGNGGAVISYENGQPTEVTVPNDGTYSLTNGTWWHRSELGGRNTLAGKIHADDNGNIFIDKGDPLKNRTYLADGSQGHLRLNPNYEPADQRLTAQQIFQRVKADDRYDSVLERADGSRLITDASGAQKAVEQANGNVLGYRDGQLVSVKTAQGTFESSDGRNWTFSEPMAESVRNLLGVKVQSRGRALDVSIAADAQGNVSMLYGDGGQMRLNADGTTIARANDGTTSFSNKNNLIERVEYPNGAVLNYEHKSQGTEFKIVSVPRPGHPLESTVELQTVENFTLAGKKLTEGQTEVERDRSERPTRVRYPDGNYRDIAYDVNGAATITDTDGRRLSGTVDKDGTIRVGTGASSHTYRPDGTYSYTERLANGQNVEVTGRFDRPTELKNANGTTSISYDQQGNVQAVTINGQTIHSIQPINVDVNREGVITVSQTVQIGKEEGFETTERLFKGDGSVTTRTRSDGEERTTTVADSKQTIAQLADVSGRLASRNLDARMDGYRNWDGTTVDDLHRLMSPSTALNLRDDAANMPSKLRSEVLANELNLIRSGSAEERMVAVQMIGALGKYAGQDHAAAMVQFQGADGMQRLRDAGMNEQQANEFQRLAGQALLRMAGNDNGASAAALQGLQQPWPGLEDAKLRSTLTRYAQGDINDFVESKEAQRVAYQAGMTAPLAESFRRLGVPGTPDELERAAETASANYASRGQSGRQAVQDILANVERINALPPGLRAELTGAEHQLDARQVVGQLEGRSLDRDTEPGKVLMSDVQGWIRDKRQSLNESLHSAEDRVDDKQDCKKKTVDALGRHTEENAISLLDRIAYCIPGGGETTIDKFARIQKQLVNEIEPIDQARLVAAQQVSSARMDLAGLELAERAGRQAEISFSDQRSADRHLMDTIGTTPRPVLDQFGLTTMQRAEAAVMRLGQAGEAQQSSFPNFNSSNFSSALNFATQLHSENTEGLRQSDKAAMQRMALDAIDADPTMRKFQSAAFEIADHAPTFYKLVDSGLKGTRYEDFVKLAHKEANALQGALDSVTPQDIAKMNAHIREINRALEGVDRVAEADTYNSLKQRAESLKQLVDVLNPDSPQNHQLRHALRTVLDSDSFDESTFANWAVKDGPVVVASIAAATAVIVLTAGTGTPAALAIAAAGIAAAPAAGMLAAEGIKEAQYIAGWRKDPSLVGEYARGREVLDESTGKLREMSFTSDVAGTYLTQYRNDLLITAATMGFGKGLSTVVNKMGTQAFGRFLAANSAEITATARTMQEVEQAAIKAGVQRTFVKEFSKQFFQMSGFAASQAVGEDSLKSLFQGESQMLLPVVVGTLLTAAHGVNFRPRPGTNRVEIDMDPAHPKYPELLKLMDEHQAKLRQDGNKVTAIENGYKVRGWNGQEVVFELSERLVARMNERTGTGGGERTAPPAGERPAPPAGERPVPPAGERPAPPVEERPAPPAGERPAPPAGERPAPPAGERPAPPLEERPVPAVAEKPPTPLEAKIEPVKTAEAPREVDPVAAPLEPYRERAENTLREIAASPMAKDWLRTETEILAKQNQVLDRVKALTEPTREQIAEVLQALRVELHAKKGDPLDGMIKAMEGTNRTQDVTRTLGTGVKQMDAQENRVAKAGAFIKNADPEVPVSVNALTADYSKEVMALLSNRYPELKARLEKLEVETQALKSFGDKSAKVLAPTFHELRSPDFVSSESQLLNVIPLQGNTLDLIAGFRRMVQDNTLPSNVDKVVLEKVMQQREAEIRARFRSPATLEQNPLPESGSGERLIAKSQEFGQFDSSWTALTKAELDTLPKEVRAAIDGFGKTVNGMAYEFEVYRMENGDILARSFDRGHELQRTKGYMQMFNASGEPKGNRMHVLWDNKPDGSFGVIDIKIDSEQAGAIANQLGDLSLKAHDGSKLQVFNRDNAGRDYLNDATIQSQFDYHKYGFKTAEQFMNWLNNTIKE